MMASDELRSSLEVIDSHKSAAKSSVTMLSSVLELLECPVCLRSMYPPIYQCFNGHPLCSGCKSKVRNKCPTCRHKLGDIRCLMLEKVAESVELPCKYQDSGCSGLFPYHDKLDHESNCSYRPYNCPIPGSKCSVLGDIPSLVSHLKDHHKVIMDNGGTFKYTYVKSTERQGKDGKWNSRVISSLGQYFYLHFEAFQPGVTPLCIAFLRLIGNDEEAKSYTYSLEFEGNGRTTIWQGRPRSIRDNHKEVRENLDGLIIQQKFFSRKESGDGKKLKLTVRGRIWKNHLPGGVSINVESRAEEKTMLPVIESCKIWKEGPLNLLKHVYSILHKIEVAFAVVTKAIFRASRRGLRI